MKKKNPEITVVDITDTAGVDSTGPEILKILVAIMKMAIPKMRKKTCHKRKRNEHYVISCS